MGGRARRRRSGFRRQRPISRRVVLAVAVCPAVGRPSSPLAAALSDVGVFHVLDLGLRPNEPHRARCRSSASTSDEHVWLCASRAGRQRPRRLRFQSDTTSCTERSNGDQENQQRFALRGRSLSARALSRYFLDEGTAAYTHVSDQHSTYGHQGHPHYWRENCESFGRS